MKKALAILLAIGMVFAVFADEPVANLNVSEFSGEASVTWGVDLDAKKTGFKNDSKITLKLNLFDNGDKSSTGEGVWGEIKIKTDGDTFYKDEVKNFNDGKGPFTDDLNFKMVVDTAKLHFGDNAYIGIKAGDTTVGEYKLDTAVAAEKIANANVGSGYTEGIVLGYGNDNFSIDVDFRSAEQYTNAYAFAIDGALKAVDNLTLKAGYTKDFAWAKDETVTDGFYVASDYKLGLNDTFYLKPQVGYTQAFVSNDGHKTYDDDFEPVEIPFEVYYDGALFFSDTWPVVAGEGDEYKQTKSNLVAALLFGWGDKADKKPGVYFLDNDNDKKVIPGFSVAMTMPVVNKTTIVYPDDPDTKDENEKVTVVMMQKQAPKMAVSFFSGEIVENLTFAAYYETKFGQDSASADVEGDWKSQYGVDNVSVKTKEVKGKEYNGFAFAAGLNYKLSVGEGSITPKFGIAMLGGYYAKPAQIDFVGDAYNGEILNLKAGVDLAGYVENTTFSVAYSSRNLKDGTTDADTIGTLDFTCKIAL
ncbi:MAG: hypothetical protein J6A14_01610 [Spirochaetaceae bacterium]|nr:hypothetical protein [Spirochaetaceae bacterium]